MKSVQNYLKTLYIYHMVRKTQLFGTFWPPGGSPGSKGITTSSGLNLLSLVTFRHFRTIPDIEVQAPWRKTPRIPGNPV